MVSPYFYSSVRWVSEGLLGRGGGFGLSLRGGAGKFSPIGGFSSACLTFFSLSIFLNASVYPNKISHADDHKKHNQNQGRAPVP